MTGLLLFELWPRPDAPVVVDPYRPDLPDWAQPKDLAPVAPTAGKSGKVSVGSMAMAPAVSPGAAVKVSADSAGDIAGLGTAEWQALAAFVAAARAAKNNVVASGISGSVPTDLAILWSAWQSFSTALDDWETLRQSLITAANDIIAYASGTASTLYKQIDDLLNSMMPGDPAPPAVFPLLAQAIADATARNTSAAGLTTKFAPFVTATNDLLAALRSAKRNPPIRVMLSDLGTLCLSHDENGQAIAGSVTDSSDPNQFWTVVRTGGGWAFSTADGSKTLAVGPMQGVDISSLPHGTSAESLMPEGPRPTLVNGGPSPYSMWNTTDFALTGEGYLQPAQWPSHTLDCCGNGGWDQGTPILCFLKNGGSNQHWSFDARSDAAMAFYDALTPLNAPSGSGTSAIEHLEGAWGAVRDDLQAGVTGLQSIQPKDGFVAALEVDAVTSNWANLAKAVAPIASLL